MSSRDERNAARAALTQLEFEREAATVPTVLPDLSLPAYLIASASNITAASQLLRPAERVHHGGGSQNDVLGILGSSIDFGGSSACMPGDRIATTVIFPSAADSESKEARRQRELHKQNEILQGLHMGQKQ